MYGIHPYCSLFPVMTGDAFSDLVRSVREIGLLEPIVIYQDQILDGRNRSLACRNAQVEPQYIQFVGDDDAALQYAISKNLARRHLTESQRAMIAERLATMKRGGDKSKVSIETLVSRDDAAQLLNVGKASLARARVVRRDAAPNVTEAVERGEVPVSVAAAAVRAVPNQAEQAKWTTATEIRLAARPQSEKPLLKPKVSIKSLVRSFIDRYGADVARQVADGIYKATK